MKYLADAWRLALTDGYSSDLLEDSKRKISLAVRRIENALAHSQWLVGPTYSLAHVDAFAICNSLPTRTPRSAVSRTGKPEQPFAPGPEHSRWG